MAVTPDRQHRGMAVDTERVVLDVARRHHGACARGELVANGLSRSAIDRRIRRGLLVPVGGGVYLLRGAGEDPLAAASAAVLRSPEAVVSHWTAARLHGFPLPPVNRSHVMLPRYAPLPRLDLPLTVHQTRHLPVVDVVDLDGLRVTSPARTLCDLAPWLRPARLQHLCEERFLLSSPAPERLVACHRALARRGRAGTVALRSVLDALLDDEPFPESQLELALLRLLVEGGLSGLRRQYRPPWFDGVRGIVDFADPEARLVVEADGRRWHSTRQAFDADRRRDRVAAGHGWHVLRFGWQEVTGRPDEVRAEIEAFLARGRGS